MKVVLINTYDLNGGAARSAWRLHCGLRRRGVQSTMLVKTRASKDPDICELRLETGFASGMLLKRWANLTERLVTTNRTKVGGIYFTLPVPGYDLSRHPLVQAADVLHLHWVAGFASPASIQRLLALGKPVVWTLHDQRPFTGGCHFSDGCRGFEENCAGCPELRDNRAKLTQGVLQETIEHIDSSRLVVVSPSRWLAECARRSVVFRSSRVEVIPYGLETDTFRPRPRAEVRKQFGLPQDGFCILFGAVSTAEPRKGFAVYLDAIRRCQADPTFAKALSGGLIQFLCFGLESEQAGRTGLPVRGLGEITGDDRLACLYAAADLMVCSTLEDNLPNVGLEALACGTPVLGSRVGGMPDLVVPEVNGRLFERNDAAGLAAALLELWNKPALLAQWSEQARRRVEQNFSLEVQAGRYLELYSALLQTRREAASLPRVTEKLPLLPRRWSVGALHPGRRGLHPDG